MNSEETLLNPTISIYTSILKFSIYSELLEKMILEFIKEPEYQQIDSSMQVNYIKLKKDWSELKKLLKKGFPNLPIKEISYPDSLSNVDSVLSIFIEPVQITNKENLSEIKNLIKELKIQVEELEDEFPRKKFYFNEKSNEKYSINQFIEAEEKENEILSLLINTCIEGYRFNQEDSSLNNFAMNGVYDNTGVRSFKRTKKHFSIEVFPDTGKVILDDQTYHWNPGDQQFQFLLLIARYDGEIVDYNNLLKSNDGFHGREKIRKQISKINKKLKIKIIYSVVNKGYYLGDN